MPASSITAGGKTNGGKAKTMSDTPESVFAALLLKRLKSAPNGSASAAEIAGKRPRIAVESALRAMERRGLVGRFCHPKDTIWSTTYWFTTDKANVQVYPPAREVTPVETQLIG